MSGPLDPATTSIVAGPSLGYVEPWIASPDDCHAHDDKYDGTMKDEFSPEGVSALFEQASRLLHGLGFAEGLTPAQWSALRYFSVAPPFSRTMANLARFQGLTLAPVTRTVRTLIDKGYVDRHPNPRSKRADLVIVTRAGKELLTRDPRSQLIEIMAKVPAEDREAMARTMRILLDGLLELGLPQFDESLLLDLE